MNKIDRIAAVILIMGLALLLGYEAFDYARKTSPTARPAQTQGKTEAQPVTPPASETSPTSDSGGDARAVQSAAKPETDVPPNWSVFQVEEYGYQIAHPADWPAKLAGNVLTIGDTEGDGHTKCYLTIEFQGSKASGQIIPAPTTHLSYEQMEDGVRCNATLSKIAKSGRFQ